MPEALEAVLATGLALEAVAPPSPVSPPMPLAVAVADADFTDEELRLEREVEQALREVEAAEAAVVALRQQLQNATDEAESSRGELAQLRRAMQSWERAAEDGRRELEDRQQRLDELMTVLPEEPEAPEPAAARQEALESQQQDLALARVRVLEGQTARLEEQVAGQQEVLRTRTEERRSLERQLELHASERDLQRAAQRDARSDLRAQESRLRTREESLAVEAKRREALEREAVRLRGEGNGLRARLPRANEAQAARAKSLQLQRQVVSLWEALKHCDEQARAALGAPARADDVLHTAVPAAAG